MKVGIYSELFEGSAVGGREFIVAILAEEMAREGHRVEFLHHQAGLSAEAFAAQLGISEGCIHLRRIETRPRATLRDFQASRAGRKTWDRELSRSYDLFINIVHANPALCYAPRGVLMVLFPFFEPFNAWSGRHVAGRGKSRLWVLARHLYLRWQWPRCMASYQLKTSISAYSQMWTKRRWKVESAVIYPPTDGSFAPGPKSNQILSIGRFTGWRVGGLSKRQLEMMRAFGALCRPGLVHWQYQSIGALGTWPQDAAYLREVEAAAQAIGAQAHVMANAPRDLLKQRYAAAKIFWHAAGFGDDDNKHPELMEHFGIATVDAMAAGCVPVVINKGAQPEIVEHGVSGFLWNNLDELKGYTLRLIEDDALRGKMAEAAQVRARTFSREAFIRRWLEFVRPILP